MNRLTDWLHVFNEKNGTASILNKHTLRAELGDFNSIICFRAIVIGLESELGTRAATITLVAAGRVRGKQLAKELGLNNTVGSLSDIAIAIDTALGAAGTRLCIIDKIESAEGGKLHVHCRETVCSAGEPQGSTRQLSYTLGTVQGILEEVSGKRLRGKQIASVLRGSLCDVIEFSQLI